MAHSFSPTAEFKYAPGLAPAADAAGRTGAAYFDMGLAHKVFVEFHINQGAANTVACSLSKANSAGGSGAAAVTEPVVVHATNDLATAGPSRQTDAASFTTSAATGTKVVVLEIDPAKIGQRFIAPVTGASAAGNITSALIRYIPRYQAA